MSHMQNLKSVDLARKVGKIKKVVLHQHWHHHFLRGALIVHVTHYSIACHEITTWDGATELACGVFVIAEYIIACREAHAEECKEDDKEDIPGWTPTELSSYTTPPQKAGFFIIFA